MPISKSAKKSLRVSQHKTSLNHYRKELIKDALKKVEPKTAAKAVSMIDKGAKWGLFHPNKAARMKSALMTKLDGPLASAKTATPKAVTKPKAASKPKVTAKKATVTTKKAAKK